MLSLRDETSIIFRFDIDKLSFTCENKSAAACTKIGQTLEKPREFRSGFPLPNVTVEKLGVQSAARVPLVDLDKLTFNAVRLEDRGVSSP